MHTPNSIHLSYPKVSYVLHFLILSRWIFLLYQASLSNFFKEQLLEVRVGEVILLLLHLEVLDYLYRILWCLQATLSLRNDPPRLSLRLQLCKEKGLPSILLALVSDKWWRQSSISEDWVMQPDFPLSERCLRNSLWLGWFCVQAIKL